MVWARPPMHSRSLTDYPAYFAMNLPNRRAAKLILLGDLRVRVRVRISGGRRTRTPTRTLPSLKLDAFALRDRVIDNLLII